MVISLEDYRARRRPAAARPTLRLAAVRGGASATLAIRSLLMPWQVSTAVLGLSPTAIDPRLLYADATLIWRSSGVAPRNRKRARGVLSRGGLTSPFTGRPVKYPGYAPAGIASSTAVCPAHPAAKHW